jgi:REP element-mobilizing transposase RayT
VTRPLRIEFPGAVWHIISRGNERRDIYRDDDDRRRFLGFLAHAIREHHWRLHAWVLMSNHYHLLLETPEAGLSLGMKYLNQFYAEYFNERYERVGHLYQDRFKGILVEREGHLLELVRYIVLNPVKAGCVTFPGDYRWSNYRATAGLAPAPSWLEIDWTLEQFHPHDRVAAREAYRQFVTSYDGRPSLDTLVAVVASTFHVTVDDLREKSRGPARKALAHLAIDDGGLKGRQIAEWMGTSEGSASKMRQTSKERYASDSDYRTQIDGIRVKLRKGSDP